MNRIKELTATNQKLRKISISQFDLTSETSSNTENEFMFDQEEVLPEYIASELKGLIVEIKTSLLKIGVFHEIPEVYDLTDSIISLKSLVKILCKEVSDKKIFNSNIVEEKEIAYKEQGLNYQFSETPVTLVHKKGSDVIGRIFKMPDVGMYLTQTDCKDLSCFVIGAVRDSASNNLQKVIDKLQEKVIFYGKELSKTRKFLREKEDECEIMKDELNINTLKVNWFEKKKLNQNDENTFNSMFSRSSNLTAARTTIYSNYSLS